jgi:hypothetical protein
MAALKFAYFLNQRNNNLLKIITGLFGLEIRFFRMPVEYTARTHETSDYQFS